MQTHFLNSEYVRFFQLKQPVADQQWYDWLEQGQAAISLHQYTQAARLMGKCFELARILCNYASPESGGKLNHIEKLAVSGHGLAECYKHLGDKTLERQYLMQTHQLLMSLFHQHNEESLWTNSLYQPVCISAYMLKRHFEFYQEPFFMQEKLEEDLNALKQRHWH